MLDPDSQLSAFQRALAVPDLLLILGPPGTGKTRTITEIAAACTARGERVLVTSHTNRAVDNVLEQLPEDIRVVRVGNEDAITGRARGLMVENHLIVLRDQILASTEGTVARLAVFTGDGQVAGRWMTHLSESLVTSRTAEREARSSAAELDEVVRRVAAPLADRIAVAEARLIAARAAVERLETRTATWERRYAGAQARTGQGMFALAAARPLRRGTGRGRAVCHPAPPGEVRTARRPWPGRAERG